MLVAKPLPGALQSPLLVVAPHPLDETLGCGGSLKRFTEEGGIAHVLILFGEVKEQYAEAEKAATILGLPPPGFACFPANRSDSLALCDLVNVLAREIERLQPSTLLVPWHGSLHIDHQRTAMAAITAARPLPGTSIKNILAYEILSSSEWGLDKSFHPTCFVSIESSLETKLKAIRAYGRDLRLAPHARSLEAVQALALIRGAASGHHAAEALQVMRMV